MSTGFWEPGRFLYLPKWHLAMWRVQGPPVLPGVMLDSAPYTAYLA